MSRSALKKMLAVPGFVLGEKGLEVVGEPSFEDWSAALSQLKSMEKAVQWWIGDALNYGEKAYGEKYAQAVSEAEANTWRQYAWIANRFEMSLRRDISWSHHKEVAALPDEQAVELLSRAKRDGLSSRDLKMAAKSVKRQLALPAPLQCCQTDDLHDLVRQGRKFGCIYADPPWRYDNQSTRAATDNHYDTMTLEEIAALPVGELAAEKSHLHLWTTDSFLEPAIDLLKGWGFERRQMFVWVKPQLGIGNYWRSSHEYMLLGVRGGLTFENLNAKSWEQFDRTRHSAKPEGVRKLVEKASPGPRIELFARQLTHGWTSWGNEIERRLFDSLSVEDNAA